ncbi:MAG: tetratricopeptide repeat protein [Deinococcota bacterium]
MPPCLRLGLFLLIFGLGIALAGPRELIISGRYGEAYREAQNLGAEGLVWAARAANLYATYLAQGDEITLWFTRAEQAATQALKLNPRSAEAHFELARAQGGLLSRRGIFEAAAMITSMREHLEEALRIKPDYAEAKAALAVWHAALAQAGIGWLYGADFNQANALFEEALKLEDSIVIRVWYALALQQQGKIPEARRQLEKALAMTPKDAADRFEQDIARERIKSLK